MRDVRNIDGAASLAAGLVGALWLAWLMTGPAVAIARYGRLCGHAFGAALHCPSCYAAATLLVLGLLGAVWVSRRGRVSDFALARSTIRRRSITD